MNSPVSETVQISLPAPGSSKTKGDHVELHQVSPGTWVWLSSPCTDMVRKGGWHICSACTKVHTRLSAFLKLVCFIHY